MPYGARGMPVMYPPMPMPPGAVAGPNQVSYSSSKHLLPSLTCCILTLSHVGMLWGLTEVELSR